MTGTTDEGRGRPGSLAERDEQWSALTNLLADAAAGHGQVALVTGPVASGKTELLHAFAGEAARSGAEFGKAVCSRSESALPFGVAAQLFRALALPSGRAEEVTRLLRAPSTGSLPSSGHSDPSDPAVARVLHELCLELLDHARTRTLLIGVEDIQHADPPSLHWLLYLIRRLAPARVLLVLTDTPGPRHAPSPLHTEFLRHPHCHSVTVSPLSEQGVAAVLDGGLTSPAVRRTAAAAHRVSGGNPLLVRALLEDQEAAVPGTFRAPHGSCAPVVPHSAEITVGAGFQKALLSCLDRCEPGVAAAARALAVLGEQARPAALARLAGADTGTVDAALGTMHDAGLLDAGRFRHPAAREAVLESIPPQERDALHLAAAALLHDEGAPAAEVAAYLDLAGQCTQPSLVPVLEEAAEQALREDQIATAVRYLELIHRSCDDRRRRTATEVKLVCAESRANPAAAAHRLPALAEAVRAGSLTARDATALIVPLLTHGRLEDAAEALDRARQGDHGPGQGSGQATGQGPGPVTEDRAAAELRAVELWLACTCPRLAHRAQLPHRPDRRQGEVVNPVAGPLLNAATALAQVLTQGTAEHAVTDAEHVLQTARHSDSTSWGVEPALLALYALVYADRLDIAQPWCERLLADSRDRGTTPGQALFAAARAEIALRRGELAIAAERAHAALALMPAAAWGVAIGLPLGCLIAAETRRGRHAEAAAHLEQPVPEGMFQTRYGLHYLHARGQHYLATDRHYAAVAEFLSCRELMTDWGLDTPGLVPWRTSTAEAWLSHGGNHHEARRLNNEQLAKLGPGSSRTRGAVLRLMAALTKAHHRPPLLAEAVAVLEDHGDQYELARALADLSSAHRELRAHRRAWSVARRAWHVANACDATALCEELLPSRTRGGSPELGAQERRPDPEHGAAQVNPAGSLTDAERRVAALAAAGHTNREIAGKLCITPSTIEQHLTRVYRKLRIKYRRDLPADLQAYLSDTA